MEIDWHLVNQESMQGKLLPLLNRIPLDQWHNQSPTGSKLIHFACFYNNYEAALVLIKNGVSAIEPSTNGVIGFEIVIKRCHLELFIALCIFYTKQNIMTMKFIPPQSRSSISALEYFVARRDHIHQDAECAQFLIANGVRLDTIREIVTTGIYPLLPYVRDNIPLGLILFEQGVLRCRDAIVVLLVLKKRSRNAINHLTRLKKLDRFLVQQVLAVEIWTTRADKKWRPTGTNLQRINLFN